MPTIVDRERVRTLVAEGAQLVDVLPASAYRREHLPGAASVPLAKLSRSGGSMLRRDRPVVVYCADRQ